MKAKILDVTHNEITDVGYNWFYGFPNILKIDLRYNYITNIWNEAFAFDYPSAGFITSQLLIDLSNNYLNQYSKIYEAAFRSLKRPSTLNLSNNQFTGLQQEPFGSFLYTRPENQILIYNNSIICNCDLSWIKDSDSNQSKNSRKTLKGKIHGMDCVNCGGKSIFDVKNVCEQQCEEKPGHKLSPGEITAIVVPIPFILGIPLVSWYCYKNNVCSRIRNKTVNVAGVVNKADGVVNITESNINSTGINTVAQEISG
jgi:hypothetical protein